MAKKQEMKLSEARVLLFLNQVHPTLRYTTAMSIKLGIEYGYLLKIIKGLLFKGWIVKPMHLGSQKVFYNISEEAKSKLELAKLMMIGEGVEESGELVS